MNLGATPSASINSLVVPSTSKIDVCSHDLILVF